MSKADGSNLFTSLRVKNCKFFILFLIIFSLLDAIHAQDLGNLKSADKFKISGQLGASLVFYNVKGRPANRPDFSWMIVGNPVVAIYGITFPFSFTVSEQQRSFQQPFNKIGVSPYYKWAKLHLGYRNVVFSKYTLGGHTILGAGGEFTPGKFQIGILYGRLMKPIDANPALPSDTLTQVTPTYKRNGLAMKLGYGTPDNNIDVILFRASDVTNSLNDTSQKKLSPAANVVFSIVTQQKFLKHFEFRFEFANSIYTNDIRLTDKSGEKMPPLYPGMITINSTTTKINALESSFSYDTKIFNLKLQFRQIDPGFSSMGTYFMQNDLRNITIDPTLFLAQKKYIVGGSIGFQRDNLKNSVAHQTNRTIASVKFSGSPVKWYHADIVYSNYDLSQQSGLYQLDTLNKISQTSQSINFVQNVSLTGEKLAHNILVSLNGQKLTDRNKNTIDYNSYKSFILMCSYIIGYLPLNMNLSVTGSFTHFNMPSNDTKVYGPAIAYSASFLKNSMNLSLGYSYFASLTNNDKTNNISMYSFNITYKIKKKHLIKFRYYLNDNESLQSGINSYTENKGELGYAFIF